MPPSAAPRSLSGPAHNSSRAPSLPPQFSESQSARAALQAKLEATSTSLSQANSRIKDLSTQLDAAKRAASAAQFRYNESYKSLQAFKAKVDSDAKALANANDQL